MLSGKQIKQWSAFLANLDWWAISALFILLCPVLSYGIYPDEVASLITAGRFFDDGLFRQYVHVQCGLAEFQFINPLFYPAAATISAFSLAKSPEVFRILVWLVGLSTTLIFYHTLRRLSLSRPISILIIFAAVGGVGSIGFGIFRGELFIALFVACLVSYLTWFDDVGANKKGQNMATWVVVFMFSLAVYVHAWTLYFTPVALVALPDLRARVGVLLTALSGYFMWDKFLFKCPDQDVVALHKSFNVSPFVVFADPQSFFEGIANRVNQDSIQIWKKRLNFNESYSDQINYLPGLPKNLVNEYGFLWYDFCLTVAVGICVVALFFSTIWTS